MFRSRTYGCTFRFQCFMQFSKLQVNQIDWFSDDVFISFFLLFSDSLPHELKSSQESKFTIKDGLLDSSNVLNNQSGARSTSSCSNPYMYPPPPVQSHSPVHQSYSACSTRNLYHQSQSTASSTGALITQESTCTSPHVYSSYHLSPPASYSSPPPSHAPSNASSSYYNSQVCYTPTANNSHSTSNLNGGNSTSIGQGKVLATVMATATATAAAAAAVS